MRELGSVELGAAVARWLDAEKALERATTGALEALRAGMAGTTHAPAYREALRRVSKGHVPDAPEPALQGLFDALAHARRAVETARGEVERDYEAARRRAAEVLRARAAEPRFREAIAWQNRAALRTGLDALLRHAEDASDRRSNRKTEDLVASYLTRYSTKNDTIGFFGPIGWATLSDADEPFSVVPGPAFLARRGTYLEQWGIDAIADLISSDEAFAPWIAPRKLPFVRIDGPDVHSPMGDAGALPPAWIALLRACDGRIVARDLAEGLIRAGVFANESEIFDALRDLRQRGLITWKLELPLGWKPEQELVALLDRVRDEELRARAQEPLDELEHARARVAAAAGNAEQLDAAIASLEQTFTSITGKLPSRSAGMMYASRTLVFEDTLRDIEATVGREVLARLGPPLSLLLTSTRWYVFEVGRRYAAAFRELFASLAKQHGERPVPLVDFWLRGTRLFFGKERPLDLATAAFQERWARLLGPEEGVRRVRYDSAELGPRVRELFAAPGPGWLEARYHSPDLMISAASIDAIRNGDYELVLGEVHVGTCTLDRPYLFENHPAREELLRAAALDVPEPRTFPPMPKDTSRATVRTSRRLVNDKDLHVELGEFLAKAPRDRVVPISELFVVERGDRLVVVNEAGTISVDLVDFYGDLLSLVTAPSLSSFSSYSRTSATTHRPRVNIDRLVVQRETWTVKASELLAEGEKVEQFLAIRRWAHAQGLPRYVFARSPLETKPTFVDLDSPISTRILAKIARRLKEVGGDQSLSFAEMLPDLDHLWLPDAAGERYTAELRIVAVDTLPPRGEQRDVSAP